MLVSGLDGNELRVNYRSPVCALVLDIVHR